MHPEGAGKVPVVEQLNEAEKIEQKLKKEYTLSPDGTIIKINDYLENPESATEQLA